MTPTTNHDNLVSLLRKNLQGTLTLDEQQELSSLLNNDKKLAELNQQLGKGDLIAQKLSEYEKYDSVAAFAKLRRLTSMRRSLKRKIVAATAIAASIAIATAIWLHSVEQQAIYRHEQTMALASHILPGATKAHIKLANGQVVELGDSSVDINIDGLGSVQAGHGTITYQGDTKVDESLSSQLNEIFIPRGGEYVITLDDGTKVWLNSESRLSYPVKFSKNERQVSLTGEAFFDVAPNSAQPFIIHSPKMNVTVKGTSFNIKDYTQESAASATLLTGILMVGNDAQSVEIQPHYQATSTSKGGSLSVRKVDPYAFTSWIDNKFVFSSQKLNEILNSVARWYDIDVEYSNIDPSDYSLTGKIPRDVALDQVLEILEMITDVQFTLENRKLIVNKR